MKQLKPIIFIITIICFLFAQTLAFGQDANNYKVVANVIDANNVQLEYANIFLLNKLDSTVLSAGTCYDGKLEIAHNKQGAFTLMITSLGYTDKHINIMLTDTLLQLGNIAMQQSTVKLDEVSVKANIPIVKQVGAKTMVNVAATSLVHLPTVLDVIGRAPGVYIKEGEINVWGRGVPVIYIDGQKIKTFSEFTDLQPNEIISFEVDKNPSSKYDANVTSVITIKTTRSKTQGVSLQVYNTSVVSRRYSNIAGVGINTSHNKLRSHISYNYSDSRKKDYEQNYDANNLDIGLQTVTDSMQNVYDNYRHNIIAGLGYKFNAMHDVSFQYVAWDNYSDMLITSKQFVRENASITSILDVDNSRKAQENTSVFSTNYKITPNDKFEINFWGDYIIKQSNLNQNVLETSLISSEHNNNVLLNNRNNSDAFSAKLEGNYKINDHAELLIGGRYGVGKSSVASSNIGWQAEGSSTEQTEIFEDNIAAYALFTHSLNKFGYELGLRGEASANKTEINNAVVRNYSDARLFPSLSIYTNELFSNIDISLSYMNKIERPSFSQYNPIKYYLNPYTYTVGNPNVMPTIENSLSLDLTLFKKLNVWASYDYNTNSIVETGFQDPDNNKLIQYTNINIDVLRMFDFGVSYSNKWNWFGINLSTGATYQSVDIPYLNNITESKEIYYYAQPSIDAQIAKNTNFSVNYYYTSPSVYFITNYGVMHDLSCSISQYFFNRKLLLSISANDILRRSYSDWNERYLNYETKQTNSRDSRNIRITLRYNFRDLKNTYKQQRNYNQELQKLQ